MLKVDEKKQEELHIRSNFKMGLWKQLEPTPPHLTYLVLSSFLIAYALFSSFIRNRLHLSEPPLATLVGIAFGPKGAGALDPVKWGLGDDIVMEFVSFMALSCLISMHADVELEHLRLKNNH
jgi:NhaP-type Na+/H+ or K+/H+ antiporter